MTYPGYQYSAFQAPHQRFGQIPTNYAAPIPAAQNAPQMPTQQGMMIRPVTSMQEASVFQIPFDGSTSWFYDTSSDRLYSKTFDFNSGTAPVITYVREQPAPAVQYATLEDVDALRKEIESLRPRKAGKKNEQSDVSDE